MTNDLARIAGRAPGRIEVREVAATESGAPPPARLSANAELAARTVDRVLDVRRRTSSFSGLVAGRRNSPGGEADAMASPIDVRPSDEGLDHDAVGVGVYAVLSDQVAGESPDEIEGEVVAGETVALADFPAGAAIGTALHSVLEHVDFARVADPEQRESMLRELDRHGVAPRWAEHFVAALPALVEAPLKAESPGLRLASIAGTDRIDEMEFIVPVALGVDDRPRGAALSPAALAGVFDRHAASDTLRGYAARLDQLDFLPLEGFLKGFVDLVFRHEARWHVVDYKSNWLGTDVSDYAPGKLIGPMIEHDYILQYHLYVLALHRQLARRLPAYDYDRDMGDVFYLFLRGLSVSHPIGTGVYRDRPPVELIEALSEIFHGRQLEGVS